MDHEKPAVRDDLYVEARTIQNRFEHGRRKWLRDNTEGNGTIEVERQRIKDMVKWATGLAIHWLKGFDLIMIQRDLCSGAAGVYVGTVRVPAALVTALFEEQEQFERRQQELSDEARRGVDYPQQATQDTFTEERLARLFGALTAEEFNRQKPVWWPEAQRTDTLQDYQQRLAEMTGKADASTDDGQLTEYKTTSDVKLDPCGKCGAEAKHGKNWMYCPNCRFLYIRSEWPNDHDPKTHTLAENIQKWNEIQRASVQPLSSKMALWLIWLVQEWEETNDWDADTRKWLSIHDGRLKQTRGGDYAKLTYWDLIRPKPNDDPAKKNSGLWQPTERGVDFVHRRIEVPSHVFLYDSQKIGMSDKRIDIEAALGKKFDYQELMRG